MVSKIFKSTVNNLLFCFLKHRFLSDSSSVVSHSVKEAGVNWGREMKQGMMGRRKGKKRDDW